MVTEILLIVLVSFLSVILINIVLSYVNKRIERVNKRVGNMEELYRIRLDELEADILKVIREASDCTEDCKELRKIMQGINHSCILLRGTVDDYKRTTDNLCSSLTSVLTKLDAVCDRVLSNEKFSNQLASRICSTETGLEATKEGLLKQSTSLSELYLRTNGMNDRLRNVETFLNCLTTNFNCLVEDITQVDIGPTDKA